MGHSDGVGTSSDFFDPKAAVNIYNQTVPHGPATSVFNDMFGSFFGQWNANNTDVTPNNNVNNPNYLVSPLSGIPSSDTLFQEELADPFNLSDPNSLASNNYNGYGLTDVWGLANNWNFQQMALGGTIGQSIVFSLSGGFAESPTGANNSVFSALMGDPTLTQDIVAPVGNLTAAPTSNAHVQLTWTAPNFTSAQTPEGYNIYRSNGSGGFDLVNTSGPVSGLTFTDPAAQSGSTEYMVRAVVLQTGASGSYYNYSDGMFVTSGVDTSTQGAWQGTYGADGYDILGGSESLPSYASLSTTGGTVSSQTASGSQALESPTGGSPTAAALQSTVGFSVNLSLTGGTHQVSFYMVDWADAGTQQQVQVVNATTGAVLQSIDVSNFADGAYLTLNLQGNVTINFTNVTDPSNSNSNATLSGIFFDS